MPLPPSMSRHARAISSAWRSRLVYGTYIVHGTYMAHNAHTWHTTHTWHTASALHLIVISSAWRSQRTGHASSVGARGCMWVQCGFRRVHVGAVWPQAGACGCVWLRTDAYGCMWVRTNARGCVRVRALPQELRLTREIISGAKACRSIARPTARLACAGIPTTKVYPLRGSPGRYTN